VNQENRFDHDVWWGLGLTVALHLLAFALLAVPIGALGALLAIWLLEVLYIPIAMVVARRRGRMGIFNGLVIGFCASFFLIPAACFGYVAIAPGI
jgi:ABC-type amino acid transport system permease subunit